MTRLESWDGTPNYGTTNTFSGSKESAWSARPNRDNEVEVEPVKPEPGNPSTLFRVKAVSQNFNIEASALVNAPDQQTAEVQMSKAVRTYVLEGAFVGLTNEESIQKVLQSMVYSVNQIQPNTVLDFSWDRINRKG